MAVDIARMRERITALLNETVALRDSARGDEREFLGYYIEHLEFMLKAISLEEGINISWLRSVGNLPRIYLDDGRFEALPTFEPMMQLIRDLGFYSDLAYPKNILEQERERMPDNGIIAQMLVVINNALGHFTPDWHIDPTIVRQAYIELSMLFSSLPVEEGCAVEEVRKSVENYLRWQNTVVTPIVAEWMVSAEELLNILESEDNT